MVGQEARTYNAKLCHRHHHTRSHQPGPTRVLNLLERTGVCSASRLVLSTGPLTAKQSPIPIVKDTAARTILATIIDAYIHKSCELWPLKVGSVAPLLYVYLGVAETHVSSSNVIPAFVVTQRTRLDERSQQILSAVD
jgi:hypothetical protein